VVLDKELELRGAEYYDFRAELMIRNDEGLTKSYNRFHDPDESDADILRFRELHAVMDRAVLDAYCWTDIQPTCEFILDYEDDHDEPPEGRRKRKPWRYRWPDEVRDEVLARLLELNAQRAKEQATISSPGNGHSSSSAKKRGGRQKKATNPEPQGGLFDKESE